MTIVYIFSQGEISLNCFVISQGYRKVIDNFLCIRYTGLGKTSK